MFPRRHFDDLSRDSSPLLHDAVFELRRGDALFRAHIANRLVSEVGGVLLGVGTGHCAALDVELRGFRQRLVAQRDRCPPEDAPAFSVLEKYHRRLRQGWVFAHGAYAITFACDGERRS